MERHHVPPAHVAYCVKNSADFGSLRTQEVVHHTSCLSLPVDIQASLEDESPFVLTISEEQRAHFQSALAQPVRHQVDNGHRTGFSVYEVLQIVLARSVGQPISQVAGRSDGFVQNVVPVEDQLECADSSAGSQKPFTFHTDKSCSPDQSPDWVSLACVRNVEQGATNVSQIEEIVKMLTASDVQDLAGPNFRFGSNTTNIGPILAAGEPGDRRVRLSTDITPLNSTAELAYRRFLRAAEETTDSVVLEPGQILFLPNKSCVHGRDGFAPHRDPTQRRFLQRVYIRQ